MILLVLLLFSLLAHSTFSHLSIHYVKTADSPPFICPDHPCFTLEQYTLMNNFTTGKTFIFLHGNHSQQNSALNLTSVTNITLRGEPNAGIICMSSFTIKCYNSSNLRIERLTFLLQYTGEEMYHGSALQLINCSDILVSNVLFKGSKEATLARAMVLEHTKITITECIFEANIGTSIKALKGTNLTMCGSRFTNNKGMRDGGAIHADSSTVLLEGTLPNVFQHNTDKYWGGVAQCFGYVLEMRGNNTLHNNSALYARHYFAPSSGGALYVNSGKIILSDTVTISFNTAFFGGAISLLESVAIFNGTQIIFEGNFATSDGGAIYVHGASITTLTEHMTFINNLAYGAGGAIHIDNSVGIYEKTKIKQVSSFGEFINNTGVTGPYGIAISVTSVSITFTNTTIKNNFNNIAMRVSGSNITFRGMTIITHNQLGAIESESFLIIFEGNTVFDSNSGPNGGALYCLHGSLFFYGNTLFTHNTADKDGGAVYAVGTSIHMQGYVNFTSNRAGRNGGAMYLDTGATLGLVTMMQDWNEPIVPYTLLNTSRNSAQDYGGAIYHTDNPTARQCSQINDFEQFKQLPYCFLLAEPYHYEVLSSIQIISYNNSANIDGNLLYGGLLSKCRAQSESWETGLQTFNDIITIASTAANERREIASKPYDLCLCTNTTQNDYG